VARDKPTRNCCGPLPSGAPKIKTLEKIKNKDFNFENQDQFRYYNLYFKNLNLRKYYQKNVTN
jgi:hypothetical protein